MDFNKYESKGHQCKPFKGKSVVFGVLVIITGLLLLARNAGFLEPYVSSIIFSWPMLLIAIGVLNLFSRHSIWAGFILISIGLFFLLVRFYGLPITLWQVFWPVLIIFIGLSLLFGAVRFRKHVSTRQVSSNDEFFEDIAIFGGGERKVASQNFKSGSIVAVFGGSKVDMSQANLGPETSVIEVVAVFGGTSLIVPSDWNVKIEVFNIFGGYADKRIGGQIDLNKTLIVKGVTVFGGGEIRNI